MGLAQLNEPKLHTNIRRHVIAILCHYYNSAFRVSREFCGSLFLEKRAFFHLPKRRNCFSWLTLRDIG